MNYSEIKSLLASASDPVEKLELLMDLGRELQPIPDGAEGTEIKGCASRVEIFRDASGRLCASADSAMVRGIVAVLLSIKESETDFADFANLGLNLGAARITGAGSIIEYLKNM